MRRVAVLVALLGVTLVLPGCGNKANQAKDLHAAIRRTQHLANRFDYSVATPDTKVNVTGVVEDDFRFKARVAIDGADAYDEVVNDDALAVRFADTTRIATLVSAGQAAAISAPTDLQGVSVGDALKARRWVLDATGAPAVSAAASPDATVGQDAVLDALTVLDYVDRAAIQSVQVKRYNPDALDPVYNSSEDTFPRPAPGSGVARYDFRRPALPSVGFANRGGDTAFPKTANFRRMAVYVKNGLVIAVREEVDLRGKGLDDFVKYERALLKEAKLPIATRNQFEKIVSDAPRAQLGSKLLAFLNVILRQSGLTPVAVRSMSLQFSDLGGGLVVTNPSDGVIKGSLNALVLARHPTTAQSAAADTAPTAAP